MTNEKTRNLINRGVPGPRELMQARHPDLFSDTLVGDAPKFSKGAFEYHLETLTNRKQEYEFEHFCRKLAEKEICPNLRTQTGPTGGGDSKVDTETYPVAEEIAERWYIGSPSAGAERWGFAFSAKKAWKPKLKSDVDKILATERDYKRIYFFTNQFVSDRERSIQEDTLSKQISIPVHIIDRAWIVEKVYENGRLDLAIAALGIEDAKSEKISRPGPRDTARLTELEELDEQVTDPSRYQGARYQLVEDCLRSAILARGLERPRSEVESRFARAGRLAQDVDYRPQRLRIAYNRAWTAYWWHEDYAEFNRCYEEVERFAQGSIEAGELGRLVTLWQAISSSVPAGRLSDKDAKVESRRQTLVAMLEPVAANTARPNNALEARTYLALMKMTRAHQTGQFEQLESVWQEIGQIAEQSTSMGTYPFESLLYPVTELGKYIDNPAFDTLYEKITDTIRQRRSDGEAGNAYTERGIQKLFQKKPYEAIRWFGRAEELLIKEEYREELARALVGSSYAYERAGLLWAARNKALAAVERTTMTVLSGQGEILPPALIAVERLVWTELQLGRIPHILGAMSLADFIASHLKLSEEEQKAYADDRSIQEGILCIHLSRVPFGSLPSMTRLPDVLERLGFEPARMAVLFILGQEQAIRDDGYIPPGESPSFVQTFFERLQEQPANKDISPQPILVDGETSSLKSAILGTEIVVETPNNPISFGIAESLLGVLEAFLATSDEGDLLPHLERFTITIRASEHFVERLQLRFRDDSGNHAEVLHPANFAFTTATRRQEYMDWLRDSLAHIMGRIFVIRKDINTWLDKIAGEERGFSRALLLGDMLTFHGNVFGEKPRLRLTDWMEPGDREWEVLRKESWKPARMGGDASAEEPKEALKFGDGPPPADFPDTSQLKHTDRRVLSPIDLPLWDRAKWRATLFLHYPSYPYPPPVLALGFKDGQAGQAIFRAWRERWGERDENDALRVAIIRGISKRNPAEYAVSVGPNLQIREHGKKVLATVSRINRMTPTNSVNLDTFIAAYQKIGMFFLAPAQMMGTNAPEPFMQLAIAKRDIHIRQASEIGPNDPDMVALRKDDEPIVPAGVTDAP